MEHDIQNAIFKEIQDVLKNNGSVSQSTKDRLILASIAELYRIVMPLNAYLPWLKAARGLTVTLAALFIALIFSILTGQVQLVFGN